MKEHYTNCPTTRESIPQKDIDSITQSVFNNQQNFPKPQFTSQGPYDPMAYLGMGCNTTTNLDGMSAIFAPQNEQILNDIIQPQNPRPAPCNQFTEEGVYNNPNYISPNQKRVGPPNPLTKISPVVPPPSHDLDSWRANNLVNNSRINIENPIDNYQSGYAYSTLCPAPIPLSFDTKVPDQSLEPTQISLTRDIIEKVQCEKENGSQVPYLRPPAIQQTEEVIENYPHTRKEVIEPYPGANTVSQRQRSGQYDDPEEEEEEQKKALTALTALTKGEDPIETPSPWQEENKDKFIIGDGKAVYQYPYLITDLSQPQDIMVTPIQVGSVNVRCGYNPEQQITSDLPANLPAGPAQKDCRMKEYNKDLFTQTIQPGVYTTNQVNEPINSNIGISFTQQFQPTLSTKNAEGGVNYTLVDPNIIEPDLYSVEPPHVQDYAAEWNVTDPRFSGYGTSYRSYSDKLLGQTKFYYDDVNAIRMPNYIVRSEIDVLPFADSYGPIKPGDEFGNKDNPIMRDLVQSAWLDNSIQFRTGLQQSLLRKQNSDAWQQRQAPIIRGGMQR